MKDHVIKSKAIPDQIQQQQQQLNNTRKIDSSSRKKNRYKKKRNLDFDFPTRRGSRGDAMRCQPTDESCVALRLSRGPGAMRRGISIELEQTWARSTAIGIECR